MKLTSKSNLIFKREVVLGFVIIMFAAFFWSLDGILIRPRFYTFDASVVVFLEHFFGALFLAPFLFKYFFQIKKLKFNDWLVIFWISFFGGFLGTIMITKAFFAAFAGNASLASVIVLQKLQPFFAIFVAVILLKEKMPIRFYLWFFIAVLASLLLSLKINILHDVFRFVFYSESILFPGIEIFNIYSLFAILAAFSFGTATSFGKRILTVINFQLSTTLRFVITAVLSFIFITSLGKVNIISGLEISHWFLLLVIVCSSGAFGMFIYYYGLQKISASLASVAELFCPLSGIILDYFFNGQILNSTQILASLILIFSFYKVSVFNKNYQIIELKSKMINGMGRSKTLNFFPTINLSLEDIMIKNVYNDNLNFCLDYGVFLGEAKINNKKYKVLIHFGPKLTFAEDVSLEILIQEKIFDVNKEDIELKIFKKIRDIIEFPDVENLKKQIKEDLEFLK